MGAPEREPDESDWKRYGQTAACFRVTRSRDRGIISRNGEISKLSAGKLRSQRLPDDWGWLPRRPSALSAFANGEFHTHPMTAIQSFLSRRIWTACSSSAAWRTGLLSDRELLNRDSPFPLFQPRDQTVVDDWDRSPSYGGKQPPPGWQPVCFRRSWIWRPPPA
jgi:hypothetical protein